jgi:hypothetical protein
MANDDDQTVTPPTQPPSDLSAPPSSFSPPDAVTVQPLPVNPFLDPSSSLKIAAADAYRALPVDASPEQRASAMANYRATLQPAQPWAPSTDTYNKWLMGQGINPTTIGGAKLVAGSDGQQMMAIPSIPEQEQASHNLGQAHAVHAALMTAAFKNSAKNPELARQQVEAARDIFPQTSSYENSMRGYLDLILPNAVRSTADLERYLPLTSMPGYRKVMSPEEIQQQYVNSLQNTREAPKQKRGGNTGEET